MKTIFFLIIFLFCTICCQAQTVTSTNPSLDAIERDEKVWKEFSSLDGRFSILFPGTPKDSAQTIETPSAQFNLQIYNLDTFAKYSVMYADYPIPVNDPEIAQRVLDYGAKNAVASIKSELLEIKEITLDGFPGRFLKEKLKSGEIMRVKMYLAGQRMYQIAITTPNEENAVPETLKFYEEIANRFLDSFKIVKVE